MTKSLDIFSLRDSVVGEYKKFATSFTTIHAEDIRHQVEAINRRVLGEIGIAPLPRWPIV